MKKYCRSDLACEAADDLANIDGTEYKAYDLDVCVLETLDVISPAAGEKLGKNIGRYITFTTPRIQYLDDDTIDKIAVKIGCEIQKIVCKSLSIEHIDRNLSILVAGLGNPKLTADAIGPETLERITITRHIKDHDLALFKSLDSCIVSAISPNVLGKTGIESADMIKAAAEKIFPDAIIVIDALAARSVERLSRTVQISDTGISPGAGIGNNRNTLNKQALGIPVIAIGIPTVVDSATLTFDILSAAGISDLSKDVLDSLDSIENFFVSLKEIDVIAQKSAILLSRALEYSFSTTHIL